ncbi:MAG: 4Fe-4S double cluster binding domain-containing protein [Thermovirgaceae bacterium]
MTDWKLAQEIEEYIAAGGPGKVGFADIRDTGEALAKKWPMAVTILSPLETGPLREIGNGPTKNYRDEYVRANKYLAVLGEGVRDLVEKKGYRAYLVGPTTEGWDKRTLAAEFPHKTAATRAGLGWIGKCALLVTKDYGSALRMCTILTDAPLPAGKPVENSLCGGCTECMTDCPVSAPTGREWSPDLSRKDIIDIRACYDQAKAFSDASDLGHTICGICMVACPWTKAYMSQKQG